MENLWITILSSAGVASVISALAGYISNKMLQKKAFINDYYAMVINKRMEAYSIVSSVANILILTSYKENHKGESVLCSDFLINENLKQERFNIILKAVDNSMWLSPSVVDCLVAMNKDLFIKCKSIEQMVDKVDYAAEKRAEIIASAHALDALVANDLLLLYDVEGFLKSKNTKK